MDDLRQLTPFVEIVRSGSFAAAARKLGVTSSAISKSIAQLERRLGVRLVNRTTRSIHLTAEGDQLFKRISMLMADIVDALGEARETKKVPTGKIRVSVGATFGRYTLIPALTAFRLQFPGVQLELSFDDAPSGLVEKGFDVGIHHGYGTATSYMSRVLCDYPLILVASPGYLARKGVPKIPADLKVHDCIGTVVSGTVSDWILEGIAPTDSKATNRIETYMHRFDPGLAIATQWDIGLSAALHDAGIAPTSVPAALQFLKLERLKIVLPSYRLHNPQSGGGKIYVLYPHREYMPAKLRVFVDFLIKWFRTHRVAASNLQGFSA